MRALVFFEFIAVCGVLTSACGSTESTNSPATTASSDTADSAQGTDAASDKADAAGTSPGVVWGTCTYTNPFSSGDECKAYTGPAWTVPLAQADCAAVMPATKGTFSTAGACALAKTLGVCTVNKPDGKGYQLTSGGDKADDCQLAVTGCTTFAGGTFAPGDTCAGTSGGGGSGGGGGGGFTYGQTPFVQPYLDCRDPLPGEPPGQSPGGKVCTHVLISGCTEFGRRFEDYASCADVLTQRPYWPADPATETAANDPRLADKAYMTEVDWARKQLEASACVCCHTKKSSPGGKASNWYLEAPGIWLDGLHDSGLAIMAGLVSSKSLGAYPAKDNNGFDRTTLGAPTTDIPRMQKLLMGEWARRGLTAEDAAQYQAFGGPLEVQMNYKPSACTGGEGVGANGAVNWTGGDARYVYVLEATASSPGVPPNLDQPTGTLWFVDVPTKAAPMKSGLVYGQVSGAQKQRVPAAGAAAPKLVAGQSYYLYVLKDVGFPITRCLFKAP